MKIIRTIQQTFLGLILLLSGPIAFAQDDPPAADEPDNAAAEALVDEIDEAIGQELEAMETTLEELTTEQAEALFEALLERFGEDAAVQIVSRLVTVIEDPLMARQIRDFAADRFPEQADVIGEIPAPVTPITPPEFREGQPQLPSNIELDLTQDAGNRLAPEPLPPVIEVAPPPPTGVISPADI